MTKLIFVTGKIGSGKTTISKQLEVLGFARVSASDCLRHLYTVRMGQNPTRVDLAEFGKQLLHQHRLNEFHKVIAASLEPGTFVCVDGLRFKTSVDEISKHSDHSLLVFLSCPAEIRRTRSAPQVSEREFDLLSSHETERSVDLIEASADLTLDTSRTPSEVMTHLKQELNQRRLLPPS